jgi:hypothetical protein
MTSVELQFREGFMIHHTAQYTCSIQENVSGHSDLVNITLIPTSKTLVPNSISPCNLHTTTAYFQLLVFNTDCETWTADYRQEITSSLYNVFAGGIVSQCKRCVIDPSTVIASPPLCNKGVATFRGTVTTPQRNHTADIFCALYGWQQFGPVFNARGTLMQVNQLCPFHLTSLNVTSKCLAAFSHTNAPAALIAGTIAGFVGAFLIILTVVILIAVTGRYVGCSCAAVQ